MTCATPDAATVCAVPPDRVHRLKPSPTSPGSMRGVPEKLSQAIASHQSRLDDLVTKHTEEQQSQAQAAAEVREAMQRLQSRLEQLESRVDTVDAIG